MPGNPIEIKADVIAITDPSEKDRDQHLWGDRLMVGFGNIVAWLFPILMIAIVTQVIIRKAGANQAWLDDAQWWMYGFAMLTGFGYAITTNSHVRVDILHQSFSPTKKAKIEVFALGWLLLPFLIMMTDILFHYAYSSWVAGEGSDSPNGLHMLYLLKMSLPVLFALAMIAAVAALNRNLSTLTTPTVWKMVLAALPASWFAAERFSHYALYGFTRITQPDINPRAVTRQDIFDYTSWIGLALMVAVIAFSFFLGSRRSSGQS
ncbi:MAG: TRAP transporter small permease subunit [Pseudomonadota bacterium]